MIAFTVPASVAAAVAPQRSDDRDGGDDGDGPAASGAVFIGPPPRQLPKPEVIIALRSLARDPAGKPVSLNTMVRVCGACHCR